jgi:hypothetical protein
MTSCTNGSGSIYVNMAEAGMQIAYVTSDPNYLANFPVVVNLSSDSNLSANAQASGNDILFTDSTGRNLLPFEIESYSSGNLVAWVNIASLSPNNDTIIYMYYGNPSTASKANSSGTWDSNYQGVWHFGEGTSTTAHDSTTNANSGTLSGGPTWTTGQIGNVLNFNAQNAIVNAGTGSSLKNIYPLTAEAWIYPSTNTGSSDRAIVEKTATNSFTDGWYFYFDGSGLDIGYQEHYATTNETRESNSNALTLNTWQHAVITWDGTTNASNSHIYVNGIEVTYNLTQNGAGSYTGDTGDSLTIGQWSNTPSGQNFVGSIDEVRVSSTVRSNGWIVTEYNNQNSPSTFSSLGGVETSISAPTLDKLMRHGEWFDSTGSIQPFVF